MVGRLRNLGRSVGGMGLGRVRGRRSVTLVFPVVLQRLQLSSDRNAARRTVGDVNVANSGSLKDMDGNTWTLPPARRTAGLAAPRARTLRQGEPDDALPPMPPYPVTVERQRRTLQSPRAEVFAA